MTQTMPDANDVLMGGGGGAPAVKFANPGDTVKGRIIAKPRTHQERDYDKDKPGQGALKVFPSGDPIMGITVELATDLRSPTIEGDDGTRTLWIEGQHLKAAVREAVRDGGAAGLEVGGVLELTFTHREDPMDKRSRKFWQATYTSAANAAVMAEPAAPNPATYQQTQTVATPPVQQTPAPAVEQTAGDSPAAKAKSLAALGLDAAAIGAALGLAPEVVTILLAS